MAPASASRSESPRIEELEGLRGLLAIWVAVSHVFCLCGLADDRPAFVRRGIWEWLLFAGPAVEVFIILSGFAIFKMLRNSPPRYGPFIAGRALRLFPVYLVGLGLAAALVPLSQHVAATAPWHASAYLRDLASGLSQLVAHWPLQLGLQLPLLHGLAPPGWPPPRGVVDFLPPAWSVTLEWQFYLVAPLLVLPGRNRRSGRYLALWLVLAVGAALLTSAVGITYPGFIGHKLWLFVLGMISAEVHGRLGRASAFWPRRGRLAAVGLGAVLAVIARRPAVLIWLLIFIAIVERENRALGWRRLLTLRPFLWLGRISYSLYLLHWPLLVGALALALKLWPAISRAGAAGWMLAVGLPVALLGARWLHTGLEAPLMRVGRRLVRAPVCFCPTPPATHPPA